MKLSPINQRRFQLFKAHKRGWWSLWVFLALFFVTLGAELIANDKPLVVHYEGGWYFPALKRYPETTFGGEFPLEANYKSPYIRELLKAKDAWTLWAPIPFSYQSINYDLKVPAPAPPSADNLLGTDDQGRDVLARLIYGFRQDWRQLWSLFADTDRGAPHYRKRLELLLQQVQALAARTYELAEFLLFVCKVQLKDSGEPVKVALHTSCSARREMNTHLHGRELLAQLSNVERVNHDHESECCGFGGTFSVRMPDISGAMVADKTRALKESGAHKVLSADCGCLMNINGALEKQKDALRGQHLASFLWQRTGGAQ